LDRVVEAEESLTYIGEVRWIVKDAVVGRFVFNHGVLSSVCSFSVGSCSGFSISSTLILVLIVHAGVVESVVITVALELIIIVMVELVSAIRSLGVGAHCVISVERLWMDEMIDSGRAAGMRTGGNRRVLIRRAIGLRAV
jgi:hypothetical protein